MGVTSHKVAMTLLTNGSDQSRSSFDQNALLLLALSSGTANTEGYGL